MASKSNSTRTTISERTLITIRKKLLLSLCSSLVAVLFCAHVLAETFQYIYDETGQLIKVIDSTGMVIKYVCDDVGNLLVFKYFAVNSGMSEWVVR